MSNISVITLHFIALVLAACWAAYALGLPVKLESAPALMGCASIALFGVCIDTWK